MGIDPALEGADESGAGLVLATTKDGQVYLNNASSQPEWGKTTIASAEWAKIGEPAPTHEPEPNPTRDHTRRLLTISFAVVNCDDGMMLVPFIAQALRQHADDIEKNLNFGNHQFDPDYRSRHGDKQAGKDFSGSYRFETGSQDNEHMVTVRWRAGYGRNTTKAP
jgi:hypothetical protein